MRWVVSCLIPAALALLPMMGQQASGSIEVPSGTRVVLAARGDGVQIYRCSEAPGGYKWVLTGPDARLLDDAGLQIGRHFAGPTWKLTDGSQVIGEPMGSKASPDAHAVAWLLLRAKSGSATGKLGDVVFIRRTGTHGGMADPSGCSSAGDAGKTTRVPYTATYTFYAER